MIIQNKTSQIISKLSNRGVSFLESKYAILGGAMSWISEAQLVSAISNAGGFGVLAAGSMSPEQLDSEIKKTQLLTKNTFGVNVVSMHPQSHELIDVSLKNHVSHIIFAAGFPKKSIIQHVQSHNAKIIAFAPSLSIAKKLIELKVDAIIIEGLEAGGHIGLISTSVLAQEILPSLGHLIPIFIAGGIGSGAIINSYLCMGASGCQLGTKFVTATESIAHPLFKQKFISSKAKDAVVISSVNPEFPTIPVRALKNKATYKFIEMQTQVIEQYKNNEYSKLEAQLLIEKFWIGSLRRAVIEGDIEQGSLMAGQSVGTVTQEQPTIEIINNLYQEMEEYMQKIYNITYNNN